MDAGWAPWLEAAPWTKMFRDVTSVGHLKCLDNIFEEASAVGQVMHNRAAFPPSAAQSRLCAPTRDPGALGNPEALGCGLLLPALG